MTHPPALSRFFRLSLWAKGALGTAEIVGGTLLLVVPSDGIRAWVDRFTVTKLAGDPDDWLAQSFRALGAQLGAERLFAAGFLLFHGFVKVAIVYFLIRRYVRAYPWAIGVLVLFTAYQGYLTWGDRSAGLLGATVLDVVVTILAIQEWRTLAGTPGTA